MELLYFLVVLLGVFCFARPQAGILVVVAVGFIQDPVRKLVPGEPVAIVLLALVLYGAVAAGMATSGAFRQLTSSSLFRRLEGPVMLFLGLVLVQSFHLYMRTGSPIPPAIGFLSYAAPFVAGSVGFVVGLKTERLLRFLQFYSWFGLVAASSVLVSRYFPEAEIFRSVGTGLMVYGDFKVQLSSGFLRTPEVAAWHAATTGCVLLVLLSLRRLGQGKGKSLILGGAGVALVVLAVVWTGRRKALVELVVFAVAFALFSLRLRGGNRRLAAVIVIGGVALTYQLLAGAWTAETSREAAYLLQRSGTTTGDAKERLAGALSSVTSALRNYGVLGVGAGAAAQGSQYFAGAGQVRWEGEFGVGRITAELGLAGPGLAIWLIASAVAALRRRLKVLEREDPEEAKLALGIASLLMANAVVFVTAAQIFGDPFVYLVLGTLAGGLAAIAESAWKRRRPHAGAPEGPALVALAASGR